MHVLTIFDHCCHILGDKCKSLDQVSLRPWLLTSSTRLYGSSFEPSKKSLMVIFRHVTPALCLRWMPQDLLLLCLLWFLLNRLSLSRWGYLPSGSSSLSISKISAWVGTKIHTMTVFTAVPTCMLLPSCWRSSLRFLLSLFVMSCGLCSWTLHQMD